MKVFLTGATGYIGSAVAEALRNHGHDVTGLARSDEAVAKLEARGITAIKGDLRDAESIASAAKHADGVIHAAFTNGPDAPAVDRTTVETVLSVLEGTKTPFLYTSGIWVIGDTGENIADETTTLNPTALVTWRPAIERLTLDAAEKGVRSIVIRPGVVYGREGGMVANFTKTARERGAARFVGTGENRWPLVDVDHLAELYVIALEKAPPGSLYMAVEGPSVRVREIAEAASRAAGAEGKVESWPLDEARPVLGPYADALVLDQQFSAAKAERELGWKPKGSSVLEELEKGSYKE
jgi:nucleoside-diphosphate-sugar epimerase